jgi:hypothetical protein
MHHWWSVHVTVPVKLHPIMYDAESGHMECPCLDAIIKTGKYMPLTCLQECLKSHGLMVNAYNILQHPVSLFRYCFWYILSMWNFGCCLPFSLLQIFKDSTCVGPTGHLQVYHLVCRSFKVSTGRDSWAMWMMKCSLFNIMLLLIVSVLHALLL